MCGGESEVDTYGKDSKRIRLNVTFYNFAKLSEIMFVVDNI